MSRYRRDVCPYSIAYRRAHALFTSGLFFKNVWIGRPLEGSEAIRVEGVQGVAEPQQLLTCSRVPATFEKQVYEKGPFCKATV